MRPILGAVLTGRSGTIDELVLATVVFWIHSDGIFEVSRRRVGKHFGGGTGNGAGTGVGTAESIGDGFRAGTGMVPNCD